VRLEGQWIDMCGVGVTSAAEPESTGASTSSATEWPTFALRCLRRPPLAQVGQAASRQPLTGRAVPTPGQHWRSRFDAVGRACPSSIAEGRRDLRRHRLPSNGLQGQCHHVVMPQYRCVQQGSVVAFALPFIAGSQARESRGAARWVSVHLKRRVHRAHRAPGKARHAVCS
jgi:hypothetical protein